MFILEGLVCLLMTCFVVLMMAIAVLCVGPPPTAARAARKASEAGSAESRPTTEPDEIDALFALGDVAGLLRVLWNDDASAVGQSHRVRAADALGRLGREAIAAVPALQAIALRDESELVRKSAAYALLLILPRESFGAPRP